MSLVIGTSAEAVAAGRRRRFDEGPFRGLADYLFETAPGEAPGPQALIARQAPGWTLPVHFHMRHQFQVVLRGHGSLGRHTLVPGAVHYTSPQSGYGPIVAGAEGLDYFTLRVLTDKGAWYLPESRPFMTPGLRKEQQWGVHGDDEPPFATLIPRRDDGLGAWSYRPAAGDTVACVAAPSDAGRFHVVIGGAFRCEGHEWPAGSCIYAPREAAPRFEATQPGGLLVVVQFPHEAVRHHVPPELRIAPSARGTTVPGR